MNDSAIKKGKSIRLNSNAGSGALIASAEARYGGQSEVLVSDQGHGRISTSTEVQNTVIPMTGEHRFEHEGVTARIEFAQYKGQWVAEYRFLFRLGGYEGCSLPMTTHSKRHAFEGDAVINACDRIAAVLNDIQTNSESGRQKRAFRALFQWLQDLKQKQKEKASKVLEGMRFVDCFAGIGGFHIALKALGAECAGSIEIDKHARATYLQNHHGDYVMHDDVRTARAGQFGKVDIVCGGFPCQSFSVAGSGEGFNHPTKGGLFFELARIIKEVKPKLFILENVKGMAMHNGGKTYETVMETLTGLGYVVKSKLLDAAGYGTAQHRQRIFLVGIRADHQDAHDSTFTFPSATDVSVVVEDILGKAPASYGVAPREMTRLKECPPERVQRIAFVGTLGKNTQNSRVASPKGKGYTLCASTSSYYWINGRARRLTPRECARMQGFPDSFKLHRSAGIACKQFGNAVAVPVVHSVAKQLGTFLKTSSSHRSTEELT